MIKLKSETGFVAIIDPDKVTSYGIDPPTNKRIWVICDGKEYSSSDKVDNQFRKINTIMKGFNGSKHVKGF